VTCLRRCTDVASDDPAVLAAITVLVGDSDRERDTQLPLAIFVYAIGRHVRLVRIELVLHLLAFLEHVNDRCSDITSAPDDALVVEAAAGKQEFDPERIVLDAGERVAMQTGETRNRLCRSRQSNFGPHALVALPQQDCRG